MTRHPLLAALVALVAAGCAVPGAAPGGTADSMPASIPATPRGSDIGGNAVAPDVTPPSMPATRPTLPAGDPHAPMPGPGTCHLGVTNGQPVPDPTCTPGATNPAVTQATIGQTICVSGWTKTVRPPTSVTTPMKKASAASYGISPAGTEYDHDVPIELGGAVDDPRNLWPEPGGVNNPKDKVENWLKREVCAGRMTLADAPASEEN